MTEVLTGNFKYVILLLAVLYTLLNFIALRPGSAKHAGRLFAGQNLFMILFLFSCYFIIYTNTGNLQLVAFFAIQIAFYLFYQMLYKRIYPDCSRVILSNMVMLFSIGIMFLSRLDEDRAVKQFLIGVCAMIFSIFIPAAIKHFKKLVKWAYLYALVGLALLVVVWRLGSTTYGAQLTLSLGPLKLQPSEFVKISFVFFAASMFARGQSFKRVVITTIIAAAHVLVLIASTDLGSGFVYFVAYLFMIYVATHKPAYFVAGAAAGAAAAVGAYYIFDHVRVRVTVWKNPFLDYERKGYQLSQSLFALSTGGVFGLGLCNGYPNSIPLARNDFIFSAICEEMGLAFGAVLILIYLGLLIRLFFVSAKLQGMFYQMIGIGFAALIGTQIFMHIGGVTGLIPSTGITLPLISFGGSSVLSTIIILGIIQGLNITAEAEARLAEQARNQQAERGMTHEKRL